MGRINAVTADINRYRPSHVFNLMVNDGDKIECVLFKDLSGLFTIQYEPYIDFINHAGAKDVIKTTFTIIDRQVVNQTAEARAKLAMFST